MNIIIDNRIRIPLDEITRPQLKELKSIFTKANPEFYKKKAMGFWEGDTPRNIYLYEIKNNEMSVMRGLLDEVIGVVGKADIQDNRLEVPLGFEPEFSTDFTLWPEQIEAITEGVQSEQGLLKGICASGKTEMLFGIFKRLQQRTIVLVNNLKLLDQWHKRALKRFTNIEIGRIEGGKYEIKDLTIASQKTVLKHLDILKGKFGCLLYDEVHGASAVTPLSVIDKFPAKYRIGATATPKRKDKKEFLFFSAFGDIFYTLGDKVLQAKGKVHEVEMIVVPTDFNTDKYVEFEIIEDLDGNKKKVVKNRDYHALLEAMNADEDRNNLILRDIKREVTGNHKCLVLADRINDCLKWLDLLNNNGIKASVMLSENSAKTKEYQAESQAAPFKLESGEISCLITSPVGNTGLDLPMIDRGFIVNPSANNETKQEQQAGRIKRIAKNKVDAKIYYYWDRKVYNFEYHLAKIQKNFTNVKILRQR